MGDHSAWMTWCYEMDLKLPKFLRWTLYFEGTGYTNPKYAEAKMGKLKLMVFNLLLKKYLLGYLVKGYDKLTGWKTQLCAVAGLAVWLAETFGGMDHALAEQLYIFFGGSAAVTLADKFKRYQSLIEQGVNAVKEEANKK